MLYHVTRSPNALRRALQAAVAKHCLALLCDLLTGRGETTFADTLATCSGRAVADALSMLPAPERASFSRWLDKDSRARLCQAGGGSPSADHSSLGGLCHMATQALVGRHPA